ncbi:MAG: NADH-quinone oxidoreductase subunit N, partial [Alphaproteobacteria bacterium]|nr:NADH-quinone oxidoreductase subunit N [Alphaproteobacteria bacterium]
MLFEFKTLLPIFPEMFLSFMALMMLLVGVFMKNNNEQKIGWIVAIIMFITFCMVLNVNRERITAFNGLFVSDSFSIFTKLMVLASSVMSLVLAQDWFKRKVFRRFEYPILLMLSAVGMMVMISANNLMTAYLGL